MHFHLGVPSSVIFINFGERRYGSVRGRIQREMGRNCTINSFSKTKSSSKSGLKYDSAFIKLWGKCSYFLNAKLNIRIDWTDCTEVQKTSKSKD